jgi:quercetin dioxygenase-like cupin family protein
MFRRLADGETIADAERRALVLLAERDDVTVTWTRYGAGERGPDPHVHREHTDAFYILDGEVTFEVGPERERLRASAGAFVAVPPNVVHAFVNESGTDASWLNMHAPDTGFATYLRALRDGTGTAFDQFDPPADGGRPAADAIVSGPGEGLKCALSELWVAELGGPAPRASDALLYELGDGRVLEIRAPGA